MDYTFAKTINMISDFDIAIKEQVNVQSSVSHSYSLIIWNDDVNTFDWVIECLVDVCNHTYEQAEQCAMIIHHSGKYAVKNGEFDLLKEMCETLINKGLNATVEHIA